MYLAKRFKRDAIARWMAHHQRFLRFLSRVYSASPSALTVATIPYWFYFTASYPSIFLIARYPFCRVFLVSLAQHTPSLCRSFQSLHQNSIIACTNLIKPWKPHPTHVPSPSRIKYDVIKLGSREGSSNIVTTPENKDPVCQRSLFLHDAKLQRR